MAFAGIRISADFPELKKLREGIQNLGDKKFTAAALKDALEKAIEPAYLRLREVTPVGPTGNLKLAAARLAKAYPKDGNAVGVIGYRQSGTQEARSAQGGAVRVGPDRAFHQWWIEFGTKQRGVKNPFEKSKKPYGRRGHLRRVAGRPAVEVRPHIVQAGQNLYIASSYNKLGRFEMTRTADGGFKTVPQYPKAFFKASSRPFVLPPVEPGGVGRIPPVRRAFDDSQSKVAFILAQELRITFARAIQTLTISDTGTISGL